MKKKTVSKILPLWFIALFVFLISCSGPEYPPEPSTHDLVFRELAGRWDEAIPLGNGLLGELVWRKDTVLRFSLDRSDLWDLRPMKNLEDTTLTYQWIYHQWKNGQYHRVQEALDIPYDQRVAPTKIPAGVLEFDLDKPGEVTSVHLFVHEGVCEVKWTSGLKLQTFVQADKPVGWFCFTGLKGNLQPQLKAPAYRGDGNSKENRNVNSEQDLRLLGYPSGKISKGDHSISYEQEGWGGFRYRIHVQWERKGETLTGVWSVSAHYPHENQPVAEENVRDALKAGYKSAYDKNKKWWERYWTASSVHLPDTLLERQYYLDMYKFGAAARPKNAPISLQAVWTADNGRLPPWKGDFHHDLNTQLSYWPAYAGNHLEGESGFLRWLWDNKPAFKKYTRRFFHSDGLNTPGVTTLRGEPMGGWIQYSMGPTVAAWLGQHFYLHWKYSMDTVFLRERVYPWISEVATFFDQIAVKGRDGKRKLLLSSSPEIFDNSPRAWFSNTTNFDLALIRFTYAKAAEMASVLGKEKEAAKWREALAQWPDLAVDPHQGLLVAPGQPLPFSHRHFSHLMAIHPLGLIDWNEGSQSRQIIRNSLHTLDSLGTDWWTGYSFAWLGNMRARARDGKGAAKALRIFASAFCLPNSFHVNGDQSGKGYSKFRYRPFTLEGNFASAAGIQEMLLQSYDDTIRVFPAIPASWKEVSFDRLRAQGAFLISAKKENGVITEVKIFPEKGGVVFIENPFSDRPVTVTGTDLREEERHHRVMKIDTEKGRLITIRAAG